ncbi:MAG: leucine-rich repeat protein [Bacteroidaceae bacterium]|nr:leucine-rich repeat protein [Bacteroidaceae bacterium]
MSILIRNSKALASGIIEKEGFDSVEPMPFGGATSLAYRVRIDGKEYFMKRLRPELKSDWRYRSAYQKEYEVGRSICNEHVVRYEAIDEDAEGLYILMEMVNGRTLEEKLATEPEYFARGRNFEKLFVQLLSGLQALHEAHVAYLDLKPENVMLTQVNSDVKIIDLGFCFADAYSHTVGTTQAFAAPELQRGDAREVDERTDIYALGQLMKYVRNVACVDIAPHMQRIIEKCTASVMQDRYANTAEVLKAIRRKRKWIANFSITLATLLALGIGVQEFVKTQHYTNTVLNLRWWLKKAPYDVRYGYNNYRILSEDSMTCAAVGGKRLPNIYIAAKVYHEGKEYRTVSIAPDAFGGRRIKSVYIPNGIKEIEENAFAHCEEIVSLHIPSSVEKLGVSSFEAMKGLRSLQLSGNIKEIPTKAFVSCYELERLTIPEGVEILGFDAFAICTSLKEVSLPSTLIKIDRGVFWRCRSLKEIRIPASVTEIGEFTFYDCDSLTDVYNYSPIPQVVPPIYNGRNITLHVPRGSEELYRKAENWNRAKVVAMED